MSSVTRTIQCYRIIGERKGKNLPHYKKYKTIGLFVPELVFITLAREKILDRLGSEKYYPALFKLFKRIEDFKYSKKKRDGTIEEVHYKPGFIPEKAEDAKKLVAELYEEMLRAGLPLPAPIGEEEMKHWTDLQLNYETAPELDNFTIRCKNVATTPLQWLFPWMGYMVSLILVMGLSASSAITILSWGLPGWGLFFCISAKFAANYVDIQGGPENRLRKTAAFIERLWSGFYVGRGKWSLGKLGLYATVSLILCASAYISWFYAFGTLKGIHWLHELGDGVVYYLSSTFAASMFYSSFGRLFNPLYYKLYPYFASRFDLSEVDRTHKLTHDDISALKSERWHKKQVSREETAKRNAEFVMPMYFYTHPHAERVQEVLERINQIEQEGHSEKEKLTPEEKKLRQDAIDFKWLRRYLEDGFKVILEHREGAIEEKDLSKKLKDCSKKYQEKLPKKRKLEECSKKAVAEFMPIYDRLKLDRNEQKALSERFMAVIMPVLHYARSEIDLNELKHAFERVNFKEAISERQSAQSTLNQLMFIIRPLINALDIESNKKERFKQQVHDNFEQVLFQYQKGTMSEAALRTQVDLQYDVAPTPRVDSPPTPQPV